ncbi:MAG: hypothetical protein KKG97_06715 [Proteobacteria bacterium]|nr:hypothetical protein [Pseudomonadota bacterium]
MEVDTSSKDSLSYDPSDSAESIKTKWNPNIRENRLLQQDFSVGQKRKETLLPNITKYCHSGPAHCENVIWLNEVWDNYYKVVYPTEIESAETFVEVTGSSVELLGYTEELLDLTEYTYLEIIHGLPSVKAIVCESTPDVKHFITILDKRDIETREKIYRVEMRMFDLYPNKQFQFSVYHFHSQKDIDIFIKNKNILFFER